MSFRLFLCVAFFLNGLGSYCQNSLLHFTHYTVDDGLPQNTIHGIIKDKHGFMWFGTWGGICRFDGYSFKTYRNDPSDSTSLVHNRVHFIVKDSANDLWIQTYDSTFICKYNYTSENFTRIPMRKVKRWILDSLNRRKNYSRKHVEVGNRVWNVDQGNNLMTQRDIFSRAKYTYLMNDKKGTSISDELISDLYLDDLGNLWVGTYNGGINVANTHSQPFRHYTSDETLALIDNHIRAIGMDLQNRLWIGTRNHGVTMIDRANNEVKQYVREVPGSNSLQSNYIRKIFCDSYGNVWIGTKHGLDKLNISSGQFTHFSVKGPMYIPNNWVYDITEDTHRNIWIGTFKGVARYDQISGSFVNYPVSLFLRPNTRTLFVDSKGHLWVGTEGDGVYVFFINNSNPNSVKLTPHFKLRCNGEGNSLSSSLIYSISEDVNGDIWIGTSNGVNRYNRETKTITCFSSKNNMPDDMVVGVLGDPEGYIWISHSKGISRINVKTLEVREFNKSDGLQGNEFSEGAYFQDTRTGELFFGGTNGVNAFYPCDLQVDTTAPEIYFTDLFVENQRITVGQMVKGKVLLPKSMLEIDTLQIHFNTRSFSIEFAGLSFPNPSNTKYSYLLEGFTKKWITVGANQRKVYYSNLPPGTYTFKMLAANIDGVWTKYPKCLVIRVLPPWYRTWWVYFLYVLIAASLLYYIYRQVIIRTELKNQVRFEKLKAEKIEELDRMKVQFFTGISHEFRTPLTLIVDPLERILNDNLAPEKVKSLALLMQRSTLRLINLVTQFLDFRKLESGHMKLNVKQMDITSFVLRIAETFEPQAVLHRIYFKVSGEETQLCFDEDKMEKVIYNLFSNAFKNTPDGGSITFEIRKYAQMVDLVLTDTGGGIPEDQLEAVFEMFYQASSSTKPSQIGTGIGLALVKQLVEMHGGTVAVESSEGKGATFIVSLPVVYQDNNKSSKIFSLETLVEPMLHEKPYEVTFSSVKDSLPIILVIEDNGDVREYIACQLSSQFKVECALDGNQGVMKALEIIPDLIISDVMMPGIDGFELCKMLKSNQITSHIPIILLTARQSTESKTKGYELGADAYITKPFSSPMLLARINNLLTSRAKLRELFSGEKLSDPSVVGLNVADKNFMEKAVTIVHAHIDDNQFDIDKLADELLMSRSQLYRKIKALTNQSVNDFINSIRMNKASELLLAGQLTVSEVAYETGFTQPNNFSRSFTRHFGITPSDFIKKKTARV